VLNDGSALVRVPPPSAGCKPRALKLTDARLVLKPKPRGAWLELHLKCNHPKAAGRLALDAVGAYARERGYGEVAEQVLQSLMEGEEPTPLYRRLMREYRGQVGARAIAHLVKVTTAILYGALAGQRVHLSQAKDSWHPV
jgi:hypothetical protein